MTTPTPVAPAKPSILERLLAVLQTEPALVTNLLGAAAALLGAFAFHVSQGQEAAIVTIGTGVIAVLTASLARPVKYTVITGAVITGLTAAAAFGLKLTPEVLGMISTALGMLLPSVIGRLHLTPNVHLRGGVVPAA
jgi:hypothetical protein